MSQSRFVLTKTNAVVLSMLVFVSACVQGYTVVLKDSEALNDQPSGRMKRMNQISCHCCSLSFNSHCCLQCMSRLRIGRRSTATNLNDDHQWTDLANDAERDINDIEENQQQTGLSDGAEGAACSCCFQQILKNPYSAWWPCCTQCNHL